VVTLLITLIFVEVSRYIVLDDEVCHGKPTFRGTRVLVSDVIELLATGLSIQEVVRDYFSSLDVEMIKDALAWAAQVVRDWRYAEGEYQSASCHRCLVTHLWLEDS
jgi:uncharacterized protein (DUF433 family)